MRVGLRNLANEGRSKAEASIDRTGDDGISEPQSRCCSRPSDDLDVAQHFGKNTSCQLDQGRGQAMKNCFIYHNSRYYLLFPVASVGKDVNVNSVLLSHMIGQVRQMYTLMNVGVQPCNIYGDSWGLRRLVS